MSSNIISCQHNFEIEQPDSSYINEINSSTITEPSHRCKLLNIRIHPLASVLYNYFVYTQPSRHGFDSNWRELLEGIVASLKEKKG